MSAQLATVAQSTAQLVDLSTSPVAAYLSTLAPSSRRTQAQALDSMASILGCPDALHCPWHSLTYTHAAMLRGVLAERYAPSTANRYLAALRGVLASARRLGLMSADAERAATDLRPVRGSRLPAGRALSKTEIRALRDACGTDAAGLRDVALLLVAYAGGLRRAEIVGLDHADYDQADGSLRVRGKGNKERRVYITPALDALDAWIGQRGDRAGPLFLPIARGGHIQHRRLSVSAVRGILESRSGQAEIARCTPHDLRRTMITTLLEAGEDLATVASVAGHANIETTRRYDRRGETAKRKASGRLALD